MPEILNKLHDDHINFIQLINYLELQLACIQDCKVVDFELILLAMTYMQEYPDDVHHPQENIIFNYYSQKYNTCSDDIAELMQQHETMPQLTDSILDMLQSIVCETPINRSEFCEILATYIDTQKQHMNLEEAAVYPDINQHMSADDWKSVLTEWEVTPDPLFHDPMDKKYAFLLQKLSMEI